MYYVYEHKKPHTGDVFYVGKGHNYRAWSSDSRNKHWKHTVAKHGGFEVNIIKDNLTNDDAIELEIATIALYRSKGYTLVNMTNGGEGVSGFKHSEESKARMRKPHAMVNAYPIRTEEHKQKIHKTLVKYRYVGTNTKTQEKVVFCGKSALQTAGFRADHVKKCALKMPKYNTHKGYVWEREQID